MDDDNKKLLELAYSASAESAFVMLVGKALQELEDLPGGTIHAKNLLSRLTEPYDREVLSETERDRLRTMQHLLIVTFARFQMPELVEDVTKQ